MDGSSQGEVSSAKASEVVGLVSTTTPELSACIGRFDKKWGGHPTKIDCRLHYVAFRDGQPDVDRLIELAHDRIINFALPQRRIEEIEARYPNPKAKDASAALMREARELFINTKGKTKRSGEFGELLLYMLLEWVMEAPIVACKMYLKTSQQMPIHGTDGIHLGFDGEQLLVYWGESKFHASLTSAIDSILKSAEEHHSTVAKRSNEIRILTMNGNLDFDKLPKAARDAAKGFFQPYHANYNKLADCHACLVGFDSDLYDSVASEPHNTCDKSFRDKLESKMDSIVKQIMDKTSKAGLEKVRFSYFVLPFPSVKAARDRFEKVLWGK